MEMAKTKVILLAALASALCSCGNSYHWTRHYIDGHRTGVVAPAEDNVDDALGVFDGPVYVAPNGKRFSGGATPEVAGLLRDVQPEMSRLKEIIAYAPAPMEKHRPESSLSNFIVDHLFADVQELVAGSGRKVDLAISNFGGIRCDLPQGNILLDDIEAMLPFDNYLCYVKLEGRTLRKVFEYMAAGKVQCVSGVKLHIKDSTLVSCEIGGAPLDDDRLYGLATIDFLLDGGDNYQLARGQKDYFITDVKIGEAIVKDIRALTAAGKPLEWKTDGRVVIERTPKK